MTKRGYSFYSDSIESKRGYDFYEYDWGKQRGRLEILMVEVNDRESREE